MITCLILLPLIGAAIVGAGLFPRAGARTVALAFNTLTLLLSLGLWYGFSPTQAGLQMVERHEWIPSIGAEYLLGIDGLSLLLVLLTSVVFPFAFAAQKADRAYCALMLIMQASLYGTFTAQNFVLWFLFYEMSLLPAYLLIKMWGGENRDRAAMKFFIYTFLGSIAMLLSFLAIYLSAGTFDFAQLAQISGHGSVMAMHGGRFHGFYFGAYAPTFVFAGIFLGLAVKVPIFPFHTWLPDAYAAAPTGVAMVLTGVLSKMGVYGFIRLLIPLFPHQTAIFGPWLLFLAVCSIVFSSLAAWAQTDLKRMVAYLSINHLGYCMLGLFAVGVATGRLRAWNGHGVSELVYALNSSQQREITAALSGVFLQIFNHGITAAALFYYVGLLEERRGERGIDNFGGLMQRAPLFCGWMGLAMFSSLGLPGLNGFISEFLIFKGAFALAAVASSFAAVGLLITAVALLRAMQALFSGPATEAGAAFHELTRRENWIALPVSVLMLWIGIAPQFLFNIINTTVLQMARLLG